MAGLPVESGDTMPASTHDPQKAAADPAFPQAKAHDKAHETGPALSHELPEDVGHWIAHWAGLRPDELAWADGFRRCSYREAADRVARLATWLDRQGVGRGDRVALWLGNRGAVLEAVFACARIGAIALPINSRLTPVEVAFQLSDAAPRVLLLEQSGRARADQALAESKAPGPVCLEVGTTIASTSKPKPEDAYEAALAATPAAPPEYTPDPDDAMILMYTSGTTGLPKGALLPHRKTLYNSRNARACFGITSEDRVLVVAPLFHSLGLQILALPALYCGAGVVIQDLSLIHI